MTRQCIGSVSWSTSTGTGYLGPLKFTFPFPTRGLWVEKRLMFSYVVRDTLCRENLKVTFKFQTSINEIGRHNLDCFFTFPEVKNDVSDACERFFFTDLTFCVYLSGLKPPDDIVVSNKIGKIKFFFISSLQFVFITILWSTICIVFLK